MKLKSFLILGIFSFIASNAQNKRYVYDKASNLPLSYVIISYDNGGFYTNSEGCFNISDIPKKNK